MSVHEQKRVGGGEGDRFVPVEKRMIIRERLHERWSFLRDVPVVTNLRAEYSRFRETLIDSSDGKPPSLHLFTHGPKRIGSSGSLPYVSGLTLGSFG